MTSRKVNTTGSPIVLTARDRQIVADVADFGVLTRHHLQELGHFGSKTRANATLLRLVRHEYLSRRTLPSVAGTRRALYLIGRHALDLLDRPRERADADRRRFKLLSDLFLEHQLLVNEVRLQFHRDRPAYRSECWLSETALRPLSLGIVPDGYVEYAWSDRRFAAFLELDRGTETLDRWHAKVQAYTQLATSGQFSTVFARRFFRVLVVTTSPRRLEHICGVVATRTTQMFWFTTLDSLRADGPMARIWLRAVDPERHALTES